MTRNPYLRLGLVLSVSGAVLAPILYFIVGSVPLSALAISTIILGLVSAMLGNARPDVSPEASQMMLQTGVQNIGALLEELGLSSRAIYVPSTTTNRLAKALIPLNENEPLLPRGQVVPDRLIARYGPNLEDMCLVVTTPGAISLDSAAVEQGGGPNQIEATLNRVVVGIMDLADAVSVHISGDRLVVEITKPKLKYENIWFYRCLGSPLASIAATVASEALDRPVRVSNEEETKKGTRIEIEVLP